MSKENIKKENDNDMFAFSVLLPIYKKDKLNHIKLAINSILNQTLKANEIVIVVDGYISENVKEILAQYNNINIYYFPANRGLGMVLADGVNLCKYDYIARMDADDISKRDRFKIQVDYLKENPNVDVLGTLIEEFIDNTENVVSTRKVPLLHKKIISSINYRNPFNHMTVMLRKEAVLDAGNYEKMQYFEDYYLWHKMKRSGCMFSNIDSKLVYVRVDNFYSKRSKANYIKKEINFFLRLYNEKKVSFFCLVFSLSGRIMLRILPPFLHRLTYKVLARTRP